MEVRTGSVPFNRFKGSGPRTAREEVIFSAPVTQVVALLKGFDVAFSPRDDHHLGKLEVGLEAAIVPLAPVRQPGLAHGIQG